MEDNTIDHKKRHDTKGYTRDVSFSVVSFTALNNVIMHQLGPQEVI